MKTAIAIALSLIAGAGVAETADNSNGSIFHYESNSITVTHSSSVDGGDVSVIEGQGPTQTEERSVGAYSAVEIAIPVAMDYVVSDVPSLKISAPANILPLISAQVEEGRLKIEIKKSVSIKLHESIRVTATGSSLNAITLSSSGSFHASGLSGKSLRIDLGGSGSVEASGKIEKLDAEISGSGDMNLENIRAMSLNAAISGSGNIRAFASQAADVRISGSGSVEVSGNPHTRNVSKSGSGNISFL